MTPQEIHARRKALGMTQGQIARLIGVDDRTWRRWEDATQALRPLEASQMPFGASSARSMPVPVQRLLRLLERPGVRGWLEEMAGE